MPTYCVLTFGCRVNQADSLHLERDLRARGVRPSGVADADIIIVNTCSVTAAADQGARQAVRRAHRDNPGARIVVTGCYATRSPDLLAGLPGVARVVSNEDKDRLAAMVDELAMPPAVERFGRGEGPCGAPIEPGVAGRTAWTLRVQTGCEQPCAFCIIPRTRGRSRSRALSAVLDEVREIERAGFREIALTGVHLGSWGRDLVPARTLAHLLAALDRHQGEATYRVSSLEPMDCTPEVRAVLTGSRRFAPHFHLPLQHASDRVLAAMRRPYTWEYYAELVGGLRSVLPHASLGSDVMVGFPGERDEDHAAQLARLEQSPLTHLHVFPYSDRPGTIAASLPDRVSGTVVRARAEEVRRVGRLLAQRFAASMVGSVRPGLTLEDGTLVVTDNYLKVRIPAGLARNVRVLVRVDTASDPLTGVVQECR